MIGLRLRAVCLFLILVIPLAGGWPLLARPASSAAPRAPIGSMVGPARPGPDTLWQIQTVDSGGTVGWDTSIAVDAAGRPHVSYCQYGPYTGGTACQELKYTWFNGAAWNTTVVDSEWYVGAANSLALDSQGRPHIAYGQYSCYMACGSDALKYAHYDGTSWQVETVDSGSVGAYTSLALDAAGHPHISYHADNGGGLKHAWHDGSTWHIETVDGPGGNKGTYTSIALDAADHPHIIYRDELAYQLKYTWYDGTRWQIETVDTYMEGGWNSLALDAAGRPHVSYYKGASLQLVYAWRDAAGWHSEVLETELGNVVHSSIALDSQDRPRIAYYAGDYDYNLRYAWHDGAAWQIETVDSPGDVGMYASLALDALDQAHISYSDDTNGNLKYALAPCVPVQTVDLFGPALVSAGVTAVYTVTFEPSEPTYPTVAWNNGAAGPTAVYSWTVPGTYTVTVTATNPCSTVTSTLQVAVICQPPIGVTADGPPVLFTSQPGTYQAVVQPITTSLPLTYTWDTGTVGPGNVYSWTTPGVYTPMLTATNACGQASGAFSVTVVCLPIQEAGFSWSPPAPMVGQAVQLTATVRHLAGRWLTETVDSVGNVGLFDSLALDAAGRPHISYYDSSNRALKYAYRNGASWQIAVVDPAGGSWTSLALDHSDWPHVSYMATTGLEYAHYDGTHWLTETVVSGYGGPTSLALDSHDRPHISNYTALGLEYAWYDGAAWHLEVVDNMGNDNSLALDTQDYPHISYRYGDSGGNLRYAWHDGSTWHIETVDAEAGCGKNTSLELDAAGRPHISYVCDGVTNALKYAYYDGTAWQIEIMDSGDDFNHTSLALDAAGRPHIAYHDFTTDELKYTQRGDSGWQTEIVDRGLGMWGGDVSLALDAAGWPQMSYNDRLNQDLRYAWLEYLPPTAPLTYTWDLGDGSVVQGQAIQHVYAQAGTYTVVLTATNCQDEGRAVVTHTLVVVPCDPVHDAAFSWTPITPTVDEWTSFHATAGGDGPIVYRWALGDGATGSGANISHRYASPGTYTVVLTATNCAGDTALATHTLMVVPPPCEPVHGVTFAWVPPAPEAGLPVTFTAAASGTAPISFTWDLGDGSLPRAGGIGGGITHTYAAAGDYTVTLTATNCATATAIVIHSLTVAPACDPPHGVDFTWAPLTPTVGEAVAFTATAAGTEPLTFTWDFGDGGAVSGASITYTFGVGGVHVVTVTVANRCGDAANLHTLWVGPTEWRIYLPLVVRTG